MGLKWRTMLGIFQFFTNSGIIIEQDRKLSDARRDTWAHTSPGATTAPSLRMVLKEEGDRIRIRISKT